MTLRQSAPRTAKVLGRSLAHQWGEITASTRLLPSFVMAGTQRGGTTSLYRALLSHPLVFSAVMHKGVNYFDMNYGRGMSWYQAHFPLERTVRARTRGTVDRPMTFDASGYYMFHPAAPRRMATDLPDVKVVVMLRDPVERAHSAYKHELARGFETESFERALDLEDERLDGEEARLVADPEYYSVSHRHHAYVRRGHYDEQLARLRGLFGPERVFVVESERFFATPERAYERLLDFLGLPVVMPPSFDRYNARPGSSMAAPLEERLRQHFAPHDEALSALLGHAPVWSR